MERVENEVGVMVFVARGAALALGLMTTSCSLNKNYDSCRWDCHVAYSALSYHRTCSPRRTPCEEEQAPPEPTDAAGERAPQLPGPVAEPPQPVIVPPVPPLADAPSAPDDDAGDDTDDESEATDPGEGLPPGDGEPELPSSTRLNTDGLEPRDIPCERDNQCGPGLCRAGECFYGCFLDTDCGTGDRCADAEGTSVCSPDPAPGVSCLSSGQCADGQVCLNATCHDLCRGTADCPNELDRCWQGACLPDRRPFTECIFDSECEESLTCIDGACALLSDLVSATAVR